MKKRKSQMRK